MGIFSMLGKMQREVERAERDRIREMRSAEKQSSASHEVEMSRPPVINDTDPSKVELTDGDAQSLEWAIHFAMASSQGKIEMDDTPKTVNGWVEIPMKATQAKDMQRLSAWNVLRGALDGVRMTNGMLTSLRVEFLPSDDRFRHGVMSFKLPDNA